MKPNALHSGLLAIATSALFFWAPLLVFVSSCGGEGSPVAYNDVTEKLWPEPTEVLCRTSTGLTSTTVACAPMQAHEDVAAPSFERHTRPLQQIDGWTVVLRADRQWSEKHQRWYFTDADLPGFLIWGMVDPATRTIFLADEDHHRAVLTHEECHAHFPGWSHYDWGRLGCTDVERDVREALIPASGILVEELELIPVSLPDGQIAEGEVI